MTEAAAPHQTIRAPFRSRAAVPLLLVGIAGVMLVLYAWRLPPFATTVQATDNAYVRGLVTVISPKLDGYVAAVPVQDFQRVKAGQLLMQIDDRIYRQRLEQAQANLAAQQANLANNEQQRASALGNVRLTEAQIASADAAAAKAQADLKRYDALFQKGWVAAAAMDQYRAASRQTVAGVSQARAQRDIARQTVTSAEVGRGSLVAAVQSADAAVKLAAIDLQNSTITAPRDGRLGEVGVRLGQYVTPGTQLMAIVPDQVWVTANFKETQMARIRVGQPASFRVDALQRARLRGHVERISPAAGSEFSVIRPDNATGNFTKVAQRIPVRISIDPGQPLAERLEPGMSVVASVDTASAK